MSATERSTRETLGRYVLGPTLGEGGQGKVQLGVALGAGEVRIPVAVKRVTGGAATRDLVNEAAKLARVQHANIVAPIDVLEANAEIALVMELVHGITCERLRALAHAANRRIPFAIAAKVVTDVLAGLHALHEARDARGEPLAIVHRDVTPDNVLVGVDGVARVIDLGIAKAAHAARTTTVGLIRGKAPYLAPELLSGAPATRQSDVFAVGRVIQELLMAPSGPPLDDDKACPSDLRSLVKRACDPAPERRPTTALALSEALERAVPLASARTVAAYVAEIGGEELERQRCLLADLLTVAPMPSASRENPARRGRVFVTVALVASLAGAAGWVARTTLPATPEQYYDVTVAPRSIAPESPPSAAPAVVASTASLGRAQVQTSSSAARHVPSPSRSLSVSANLPANAKTVAPCDPPFVIDDAGHTIFKRECIR